MTTFAVTVLSASLCHTTYRKQHFHSVIMMTDSCHNTTTITRFVIKVHFRLVRPKTYNDHLCLSMKVRKRIILLKRKRNTSLVKLMLIVLTTWGASKDHTSQLTKDIMKRQYPKCVKHLLTQRAFVAIQKQCSLCTWRNLQCSLQTTILSRVFLKHKMHIVARMA